MTRIRLDMHEPRILALNNFDKESRQGAGDEWMLEREQFVEQTAESPDVTLLPIGLAVAYFRGHIIWSANDSLRHVAFVTELLE